MNDAQEGIAVGRSFAMFKNYHIDGNKEMIAFGMMNIVGSLTSCYLTTGMYHHHFTFYFPFFFILTFCLVMYL
jgi:MFS superfamily sulfate permease-like transporter